jgi:2-aminoadipate transaminase
MTTTTVAAQNELSAIELAAWTATMKRSVLREMLAVVSKPGILSFAGGLPAPELFPTKEYAEAVDYVLASDPRPLQYGPPFGPLKRHIIDLMVQRGVDCAEEQIFITTGAQQALVVMANLLMNPGGPVLIEEIVYSGIQQAIAPYRPEILTVPTDLRFGIDVDAVEAHLSGGSQPAFIYAISEAHNPLGVSISPDRQERLVELARQYRVPILEDDPYGFLRYEATPGRPMRALDNEWVVYVGSFSKILAPALRLGWMVVPEELITKLTVVKEAYDLETSAFIQRTVSAYLDAGHLPAHLGRLRYEYKQRRDAMLAALENYFPENARWTRPTGGMFIWVEFPNNVDTTEMLWQAVDEVRCAYIPGSAFCADSGATRSLVSGLADNCLRLNFSNSTPERIEAGIAQLGNLLRDRS